MTPHIPELFDVFFAAKLFELQQEKEAKDKDKPKSSTTVIINPPLPPPPPPEPEQTPPIQGIDYVAPAPIPEKLVYTPPPIPTPKKTLSYQLTQE